MILTVTLTPSIDKLYMLDGLEPYSVMRVKEVRNTAGGKGLNVSRVAALLGEKVTAMGFVGGFVGQYFESLITEADICKAFTRVASETRSCVNGWDMARNASTEYLEPGAPVTEAEVDRFYADFIRALPTADVVTISGSVPKGAPADCYARLIAQCRDADKPVLLDTSGEALLAALKAKPTFVKLNTDEVAQLLGHEVNGFEECAAAAKRLHGEGISHVVISLGAEGALMVCGEGVWAGEPPRIRPRNTVGCGDSMVAGFAVSIVRKLLPEEGMRLSVAVSAANALSIGTGSFDPCDLEDLLPKIKIQRMP